MLPVVGISKHQYYYQPKGKRPGRKPSTTTVKKTGSTTQVLDNSKVVEEIKNLQSDPDLNYGYRKMYFALMQMGYYINHKKVYRIMNENQLLKDRYKRNPKVYAKYRIVCPTQPLELLEMDIKYVWVAEFRRHAYILTIIDTFTRATLDWQYGYTMKAKQVKQSWERVITRFLQPADMLNKEIHIEVRNDNGPQFCAKLIQRFFKENYLNQVFTHPYTPQENGHIESFHAILSDALRKHTFWSLEELGARLSVFYHKYNNLRIHSSIANITPSNFWQFWNNNQITRTVLKNKKVRFTLNIPYQLISGTVNLREVSCINNQTLDESGYINLEMIGPETFPQLSVS